MALYGVGTIGVGKFHKEKQGKQTPEYVSWKEMIRRCYSEALHSRFPTYSDCTVSEVWHNFQVFAQWYSENWYAVDGERVMLDKDILVQGNKVYSPERCIYVPVRINCILLKPSMKQAEYMCGVNKRHGAFNATLSVTECGRTRQEDLGYFKTELEGFTVYKKAKELMRCSRRLQTSSRSNAILR